MSVSVRYRKFDLKLRALKQSSKRYWILWVSNFESKWRILRSDWTVIWHTECAGWIPNSFILWSGCICPLNWTSIQKSKFLQFFPYHRRKITCFWFSSATIKWLRRQNWRNGEFCIFRRNQEPHKVRPSPQRV